MHAVILLYQCFFSPLGSAYTEPFPVNPISAGLSADEDHGRTSEEEEGVAEQSYDRQVRYGIYGIQRQKKKKTRVDGTEFSSLSYNLVLQINMMSKNTIRILLNILLY